MPTPTDSLLAERGKTHGDFTEHAAVTQGLKAVMQQRDNYWKLSDAMRESLDMIAHKIGRIISGDPSHVDHWDDIAGYARLVSQRIAADNAMAAPKPVKVEGPIEIKIN